MAVRIVFCGSVQASVSEGESSGELVDVEEMGRCSTLPFWRKDTEFWVEFPPSTMVAQPGNERGRAEELLDALSHVRRLSMRS